MLQPFLAAYFSAVLFSGPTFAKKTSITGYTDDTCTGLAAWVYSSKPGLGCMDVSDQAEAGSIFISSSRGPQLEPNMRLYSDSDCEEPAEDISCADFSHGVCCIIRHRAVLSYQILPTPESLVSTSSLQLNSTTNVEMRPANGVKDHASASKDVVPYNSRNNLSHLTDISGSVQDLPLSTYFITFGSYTVAAGFSIGAWYFTTKDIAGGSHNTLYATIFSICATILTHVGRSYSKGVATHIRDRLNTQFGNFFGQWQDFHRKRDVLLLDATYSEYLSAMFNSTQAVSNATGLSAATHIGFMKRTLRGGLVHTTPVYEFTNTALGSKFHMTAFHGDNGRPVHRIYPAEHAVIEKQPSYNSIRTTTGGWDFSYCEYDPNERDVFLNSNIYQTFYKDLQCLVENDSGGIPLKEFNYIKVNVLSGDGKKIFAVNMSPYENGTSPVTISSIAPCNKHPTEEDQNCIFN